MARPRTSASPAQPANGAAVPSVSVEEAARRVFAPQLAEQGGAARRLWDGWRGALRELFPLGSVSTGNRIRVFDDGDQAFEAIWGALDAARVRILATTYLLEPDRVGTRTLTALLRAARRGVDVTLVYDSFGSHHLESEHLAPLRDAGATVIAYNPMLRWRSRMSRLVRNHQKIVVVDDRVGFAGGLNVSEEYAGPRHGVARFRDTHLEVVGPAARHLGLLVVHAARDEEQQDPAPAPADERPEEVGGSLVQILESNVRRQRRAIQRALRRTLRCAVERCYLTSPYFVPPGRLKKELVRAATRGVDVRVLTAGLSDHPSVRMAGRHLYGRLLRAGVRVFELQDQMLHAKTAAIDGVYTSVGSFNLDHWSDRRNLEVTVAVLDRDVTAELEAHFERDLLAAKEVTLEEWGRRGPLRRALDWLAYQVLRL